MTENYEDNVIAAGKASTYIEYAKKARNVC